jgi:hypothetical protein
MPATPLKAGEGSFIAMPIPPAWRVKVSADRLAIEKLDVGGDCWFVPCDGSAKEITRLRKRLSCLTAEVQKNMPGRKFSCRICKSGAQPGVGVWRRA